MLVPGDIISIKLGDIIPADARLLEGDPLKIDQVISETKTDKLISSQSLDETEKVVFLYNLCS